MRSRIGLKSHPQIKPATTNNRVNVSELLLNFNMFHAPNYFQRTHANTRIFTNLQSRLSIFPAGIRSNVVHFAAAGCVETALALSRSECQANSPEPTLQ